MASPFTDDSTGYAKRDEVALAEVRADRQSSEQLNAEQNQRMDMP